MWPLPSSAAIPIGNPLTGLSLVETLVVATILLAGVLVFLLARLTRGGFDARVVQCPVDGTRTRTLVGRISTGAPIRVLYCAKWPVRTIACDRSCLPKVA